MLTVFSQTPIVKCLQDRHYTVLHQVRVSCLRWSTLLKLICDNLQVAYLDGDEEVACWIQAGIVSWGWGCGQTLVVNGIAGTQVPGYYTNVMHLMNWVSSTLAMHSD